jgi:hypothetical protein
MALMNVASRAQTTDDEVASNAARRLGDPRVPSSASSAAIPAQVRIEASQSPPFGVACPPCGAAATMNTEMDAPVTRAEPQARQLMDWRIHTRRRTSENASSVMRRVCTTERVPRCRATAWKANDPMRAAAPISHNGFPTRYRTNLHPVDFSGSPVLATCCVATFTALPSAARRANTRLTSAW